MTIYTFYPLSILKGEGKRGGSDGGGCEGREAGKEGVEEWRKWGGTYPEGVVGEGGKG